ncbi:A24 family peptidase [Comamonas sp. GB3 AK4-5]|uniref:prepilin peptidase n=1 Tax=Comamonas sp. GB3 AK4-5 TaxID=3231487 RepID=UPI00351EC27C
MALHFGMEAWLAALFGLVIGSFLNVVILRLPRQMEQDWAAEHEAAIRGAAHVAGSGRAPAYGVTLSTPRSHCPHCGHTIYWYQNIPVLSYLVLRGHCAHCKARISMRYPLVELATAALFALCVARWGTNPTGLAWCGFSAALLTLALIDWDTTLLPDSITLPLLWAGLLASALQWTTTPLPDAVYGAVAGYLSLWLVYWAFKLATGKEGMGYGDFKLFAALGAWLGWQALVPVILIASVLGLIAGLALQFTGSLREGGYIPFGPFLAGAGCAAMVFGSDMMVDGLFAFAGM